MHPLQFTISEFAFGSAQTRLRFPFRYGIASMTEVPQQFLRVRLRHNGEEQAGYTCEGLPPKWFTKDPAPTFAQDLEDMRRVIHHATDAALDIARKPVSYFDFWQELSRTQLRWAADMKFPPLLAGLGTSLVERAVLDALCRSFREPLHDLVRRNALGIRLGELSAELEEAQPADLLPQTPRSHVYVRHTIGLGDPLTPGEIPANERVDDGLPQDLQSSIREYGLRFFKIKLSGKIPHDIERLYLLTSLCESETGGQWRATVDGNENFEGFPEFHEFWTRVEAEPRLRLFSERILVVEQPVHRRFALSQEAGAVLRKWPERPRLIIDESDGAIGDVAHALELGYAGTSHKNCKGIVKGITNACLLEQRRRNGAVVALTGEDLCTLGPVPLLQDLAMMALLGIEHVERNGHHYYRGLAMWPQDWQARMLAAHGDLYHLHPAGFAHLRITDGKVGLESVNRAPFGCDPMFFPEAAK